MAPSIDQHIGLHAEALQIRSKRMELLAANLANADTPNYKARDIDFRTVFSAVQAGRSQMMLTHEQHLMPQGGGLNVEPLYRVPSQPSLDGNTVDLHVEQAAFGENAVRYQASLDFLGSKISSLRKALKGE